MTQYTQQDVVDLVVTPLELKFNSGVGALLCHCSKTMAVGFEHEGKTYECRCGSLHQIIRINTDNPTVYYFGTVNY